MTTERKKEEERGLADYLTFLSCPPVFRHGGLGSEGGLGGEGGCRVEPAIKILLSQPTPMAQWGENKQAHW